MRKVGTFYGHLLDTPRQGPKIPQPHRVGSGTSSYRQLLYLNTRLVPWRALGHSEVSKCVALRGWVSWQVAIQPYFLDVDVLASFRGEIATGHFWFCFL